MSTPIPDGAKVARLGRFVDIAESLLRNLVLFYVLSILSYVILDKVLVLSIRDTLHVCQEAKADSCTNDA